jgi:chemosensory pili system protein ChpA (sensor histidine kinase/response regulator)
MVDQPRGRPATPEATDSAATTQPAGALQDSLRKLYSVRSSRESFAGEAVRLLTRAASAQAGALLACDYRASRVRLIGSVGADPNVFRALLTRSGVWIALRPLNERRINVILNAQDNPFVPQALVQSINPTGLGIAVIPFYKGTFPVGVLVLFSTQESTFSQALLQTLAQALRVCAVALEDAFEGRGHRRIGPAPGAPSEVEFTSDEAPAPVAPQPPGAAHELVETERKRIHELETELTTLREAKDLLPNLQAEVERLNEEAQQARAAAEAARARAAMLEAERAEAESRALAAAEMLQALVDARDQQQRRIEETLHLARIHTDTVVDLDGQLRALSDRVQQVDEIEARLRDSEQVRRVLELQVHELSERAREAEDLATRLRASERARAALEAQVQELLDRTQQAAEEFAQRLRNNELARADLEEQIARERQQIIELAAAHDQTREQLQEQTEILETVRAEAQTARERAAAAEAQRDRLQNEQLGIRGQLDAVMAERTALRDALHAAQQSLTEKANEEASSTSAWGLKLRELEQERDRLKNEVAQLRSAFESTFTRLRAQLEQTGLEKQDLERRLANLAAVAGEAQKLRSRVTELEGELASLGEAVEAKPAGGTSVTEPALAAGVLVDELREAFAAETREQVEACHRILSTIDDDIHNRELYRALHERFHRLRGTVAAVGLEDILAQLRAGDSLLEAIVAGTHVADAPTVVFLRRLISSIDGLVRQTLGLDAGACPILTDVSQELEQLRAATAPSVRIQPAPLTVAATAEAEAGVIRVEASRLDALLDTVGQLETSRAQTHREVHATSVLRDQLNAWRAQFIERDRTDVPGDDRIDDHTFYRAFAAQSAHIVKQLSRLLDSLNDRDSTLAAVSCDLQQKVDALRLVPLDTIFRRLRRPVRDAARQEGKLAEMIAEGGNIQIDRTVIEPLHAVLLHLVRNAVAHGIESRERRAAANKPAQGTIRVTARVTWKGRTRGKANRGRPAAPLLELTVADDGGGLDFGAVLARARDRGLVRPDEMPDDARLAALIFEPGFSTARVVNGLAGRGVGMDVVKKEVTALGGTVKVESKREDGTRIVLQVPIRSAVQ